MSQDRKSGNDPGIELSPEDEAFLRLIEDSYEAAGQPKDQAGADRVWGKLEARLAPEMGAASGMAADGAVRSISSAPKKRPWAPLFGILAVAAALMLYISLKNPAAEEPNTMAVRGGASGFTASIIVYDQSPAAAPAGSRHQIRVNVTADGDGYVALFRQEGTTDPIFVSNLEYKKAQGDMHILEENAMAGTRYCIIGAKDQEGLKHLVDIIGQLWAYLPPAACHTVP